MNDEQLKRLEELQNQKDLNEAETQELKELETLHVDFKGVETPEEGEDAPEVAEEEISSEEEALSEEEAKALVTESVKEANTEIIEAIDKVVESNSKSISGDDIEKIVSKALSDREELTEEAVKSLIENTIKSFKGESKMKHEAKDARVSVPTTERKGNMPVHQKQLRNIMLGKHQDADIPESILADAKANGDRRVAAVRSGRKDLTSTTAGAGAELTPTDLSSVLQERLYLESAVAAEFASQEVTMPSNPFKIPVGKTRPTFAIKADNTAPSADTAQTTGEVTLDAEKLIAYVQYSYELDEDAIMAVLPMITNQLASAAAEAVEDAIINGQESGAIDNGVTASDTLCDGLRKLADANAALKTTVGGAVTAAKILAARKAMGKYGMKPNETIIITGFKAYNDIVGLDIVETLDKVGPDASVMSGFVPKIYGMKVIPSALLSDAVHTDGKVNATGSNNVKGQFLIVHKPSFVVGVRRDFTVETDRDITSQSNQVVASFRRDFQPLETPSASITPLQWGISVD
tara:strand:+ start:24328 stop:25890 length:1563 start_codon:yes stop_codon:yes gene_type:complete